jgi:photosystem II stability/assembly factor-like uncharacterized protein
MAKKSGSKPRSARTVVVTPFSARRRIAGKKRVRHLGITTHKARTQWYRENTTWPALDASAARVAAERRRGRASLPPATVAGTWQQAGPTNVGGRTTSVVCHPVDADRVWVGAAGGGVWHSTDAGRTWVSQWHDQESLNVGALAIDPADPDVIYCGTGEANLSADSYPGVGIYRTTDAGATWSLIARAAPDGLPSRIGALAIDPFDSAHLLVGGIDHNLRNLPKTGGDGGLYASTDRGATWTRLDFISPANYRCHAIAFDPTRRGVVFVTVTEQGMRNGIWKSADGGATWQQLTRGLPSPDLIERASLAVAPSNGSIVYALIGGRREVLGVFRTSDGGTNWKGIHGSSFTYSRPTRGGFEDELERQMSYNNTIAVHPTNPNHVICGGVDLHLTTDGGTNWQLATFWDHDIGDSDYAHADQHGLLMPASAPGRVYAVNDGGLDVSDDGGRTWSNRSNGLASTMFYDFDVAPSDSRVLGGGAQDNGTPICLTGAADAFKDFTDGDGGWIVFHPTVPNHFFVSSQFLRILRHRPSDQWVTVSPPVVRGVDSVPWMAYIAIDTRDPKTVWTGTNRVWRSRNSGTNWTAVSPFFKGEISAIGVAPSDSRRIYVGTSAGTIHRSRDGGATWSGDIASAVLPGFLITRIETSPVNPDHVIATVAMFQCSHVFRSLDGGSSWEDVDRGRLPDVPHHAVAIPRAHPREIFVAGDAGVFVSSDFGDSWSNLTGALPNVTVVDLTYHEATDVLYAATYGRSAWKVKIR